MIQSARLASGPHWTVNKQAQGSKALSFRFQENPRFGQATSKPGHNVPNWVKGLIAGVAILSAGVGGTVLSHKLAEKPPIPVVTPQKPLLKGETRIKGVLRAEQVMRGKRDNTMTQNQKTMVYVDAGMGKKHLLFMTNYNPLRDKPGKEGSLTWLIREAYYGGVNVEVNGKADAENRQYEAKGWGYGVKGTPFQVGENPLDKIRLLDSQTHLKSDQQADDIPMVAFPLHGRWEDDGV